MPYVERPRDHPKKYKTNPWIAPASDKKFIPIAIQMEERHCTMLKDLMLRLYAFYINKEEHKDLGQLCQFVAWAIDHSAKKHADEAITQ